MIYSGSCGRDGSDRMAEEKTPGNFNMQTPCHHTGDSDTELGSRFLILLTGSLGDSEGHLPLITTIKGNVNSYFP